MDQACQPTCLPAAGTSRGTQSAARLPFPPHTHLVRETILVLTLCFGVYVSQGVAAFYPAVWARGIQRACDVLQLLGNGTRTENMRPV